MSVGLKHLCGTWRYEEEGGITVTLTLSNDEKFHMDFSGKKKVYRAVGKLGTQVGRWMIKDGNQLVLREDISNNTITRLMHMGWWAKAHSWIEENILDVAPGKGEYDETYKIVKLTKKELQLDDWLYTRVIWQGWLNWQE